MGSMYNRKYLYFHDPEHGWLKVKIKDLKKLNIENKISKYSHMKGENAYLEEDVDMTYYLEAIGIKNQAEFSKWETNHIISKHTNNKSQIRNYPCYVNYTPGQLFEIETIRKEMLKIRYWNTRVINKINTASLEELRFWKKHYKF